MTGRVEVLRLGPGADLRVDLARFAREQALDAGFVLCGIGSLDPAAIRFAGAAEATILRGEALPRVVKR